MYCAVPICCFYCQGHTGYNLLAAVDCALCFTRSMLAQVETAEQVAQFLRQLLSIHPVFSCRNDSDQEIRFIDFVRQSAA